MSEDGTSSPIDKRLGRRSFLALAWASALALLTGQAAYFILKFLRPAQTGQAFGGMVRVGKLADIAAGSVTRSLQGRCYLVSSDGTFTALWQRCTHLGCAISWEEKDGQFRCQCHGSIYDRLGYPLSGPAPRPLDQFPVQVVDGEVWVDTSTPLERLQSTPKQS